MSRHARELAAVSLLLSRGADRIEHPGGTLFDHLSRVSCLLADWGASDPLRAAGLCHACYGTAGFEAVLLDLSERDLLAGHIGLDAESLVYLYASCDRNVVYPGFGRPGPVQLRDRFTGTTSALAESDAAALVELTAANELDIVKVNPDFAARFGPQLTTLFEGARAIGRLTERAWQQSMGIIGDAAAEWASTRSAELS